MAHHGFQPQARAHRRNRDFSQARSIEQTGAASRRKAHCELAARIFKLCIAAAENSEASPKFPIVNALRRSFRLRSQICGIITAAATPALIAAPFAPKVPLPPASNGLLSSFPQELAASKPVAATAATM